MGASCEGIKVSFTIVLKGDKVLETNLQEIDIDKMINKYRTANINLRSHGCNLHRNISSDLYCFCCNINKQNAISI